MMQPNDWPELPPAAHPSEACSSKRGPLRCPRCEEVAAPPYWLYDYVRDTWTPERCSACRNPYPEEGVAADSDEESVLAEEWFEESSEHRPEVYEAVDALGILEDGPLTVAVEHTDRHEAGLERLAAGRGDRFQCVARLVREPADETGRAETVRVELYGATVGRAVAYAGSQQKVVNLLRELEKYRQHAWVPAEVQRLASGKFTVRLRGLPDWKADWLPVQFDPRAGGDPPVGYTCDALVLWIVGSFVAVAVLVVTGEPWPVVALAVALLVLLGFGLTNSGPYVMSRLIDAEVWLIRRARRFWRPVMVVERLLFLVFWAAAPLLIALVLARVWPGG
jgi:hypothetical protein